LGNPVFINSQQKFRLLFRYNFIKYFGEKIYSLLTNIPIYNKLRRRHPRTLLKKRTEIGGFGKAQFIADFFGGKSGKIDQPLGSQHNPGLNHFLGVFSVQGFYNAVQVIGRYTEFCSIVGSLVPAGVVFV